MPNPDLIPEPFAQSGDKNPIPLERAISDPIYRASWKAGFPPDTRIPKDLGGEAPDGLDFNGVLNALSQAIVFLQKGNAYKFDASLTPYPIGALVRSNDGLRTFQSTVPANNNNPNSNMSGWRLYNGSGFVVNNLTSTATDSALSAAQGKVLQDNKIATSARGSANGVASLGANTRVPVAQLPTATTSAAGAVQLNNTLTSTSTTQALTAAQGKALQDNKFDKSGGEITGTIDVKGVIKGSSYLDLGTGAPDGNRGVSFYNQDGSVRGAVQSRINGELRFSLASAYIFDKTVDADISGNAASATNCSRSIVAGNGLSGGGDLTANRTLTLGTPGTVTAATGNTVSASSHTHNLDVNSLPLLGVGQTWQNVTSSRSPSSTYTNNTGRPIQVAISIVAGGNVSFYIGSLEVGYVEDFTGTISYIIPNGSTYRLGAVSTLRRWSELR